MKKSILYTSILAGVLSISISAQNKNIAFEHVTFKELKEKAAKANKLIFIDAYTTWCGPCKYMAKNIFTNDTVADYYNANFINAKIDMEKGEGIELAKQYHVNCYPNLLFIDGQGNVVHRVAGSMTVKDFMDLGKMAQQKEGTFSYYIQNYDKQKSNAQFLIQYIEALDNTCIESDVAVAQYFSLQKDDELATEQNWNMIKNHSNDLESREIKYVLTHKQKFEDLYTAQAVNEKIDDVNYSSLINLIRSKPFDEAKYKVTKEKIVITNSVNAKRVVFQADLKLAEVNKDWTSYAKIAGENVDQFYKEDANALNEISWSLYENVSDKEALLKAESWAKRSTELAPDYGNLDTYAALLYKNGKKNEAMAAANKAIEFAKKNNLKENDYKSTSDLLAKIKSMK